MDGVLLFPLDQNTRFTLKKGGFILSGSATLASGTVTVTDRRIQASSVATVSYKTHSTPGRLRAACTDNTLTITSDNAADASEVSYLVIL